MVKIIWTDEAERWLKDIHDYIAADNSTAPFTVVEGIYERAQILSKFPEIGHILGLSRKVTSASYFMDTTALHISFEERSE